MIEDHGWLVVRARVEIANGCAIAHRVGNDGMGATFTVKTAEDSFEFYLDVEALRAFEQSAAQALIDIDAMETVAAHDHSSAASPRLRLTPSVGRLTTANPPTPVHRTATQDAVTRTG